MAAGVFLGLSFLAMRGAFSTSVDPAWLTIIISGSPLAYWALRSLFLQKSVTSALLISLAMAASVAIGETFAAGEVAFIMAVGALLEDKTTERAQKGIKKLISLAPQQGRIIAAGGEKIVPVEEIRCGDLLRVLPGETIPVDGDIVFGVTSVDQSIMTGESLPVDKAVGDSVHSGTINRFGSIDIKATKVGENSSLQKLIRMVREAGNNKAPMQRIADRWASRLVPTALVIAVIVYMLTGDIIRAVTVLVVFCPCALALATPTSIMAAIGQAAKNGVLVKSGEALETMGKVDRIAFDKTGTLTRGVLKVSDAISFTPELTSDELLRLTASVEARSEHPLGKAVTAFAAQKGLKTAPITNFAMSPGKGVQAEVDGETILCGSSAWLEESGVKPDDAVSAALKGLRKQGKAVIVVAVSGKCVGVVALADILRQNAADMVDRLKKMGTEVILLTGDHAQAAGYFAERAGIGSVYAELMPEEKVGHIKMLQEQGHIVCMIGDGVNDAPALKTADVGVAMGGMGSDIALEAAEAALMGDDIAKIPYLKRLSIAANRSIKCNIGMAMLINFAAVGLSVFGLLTPVSGAFVHNAGSVLVVLNAALLYDRKL
jgi:heavy metal translocating P-type ATPase